MSVFKPTGSKTYHFDFRHKGHRFHGPTGKTEKRAAEAVEKAAREQAKRQIEQELATQAQAKGEVPLTLDIAAGRYWEEVGQHHAGADTTWTDLERLIGYFGAQTRLDAITDNDISMLVTWRRAQRFKGRAKAPLIANATVNRTTIDLLRKLFTRARKNWKQRFELEPDWKQHRLKERGEVVRELKAHEEDGFAEALGEGYRDLWRFALASGLRLAECFLQWHQIDWSQRTVTVIQKGKRSHSIPLTAEMVAIISPQRGQHSQWVFTYVCRRSSKTRVKGERYPVSYEGMKTAWRRRKAAIAPDMRFHDNRHTTATRLIRRTGNLKAAQKLLGHADIATTARFYAHVDMDDLRELMEGATPQGRRQYQGNYQGSGKREKKA